MKSQTPALESMAEIWHVLPKGHVEWGLGCSHWVWSHGGPCALGRGMTTRPAGSGPAGAGERRGRPRAEATRALSKAEGEGGGRGPVLDGRRGAYGVPFLKHGDTRAFLAGSGMYTKMGMMKMEEEQERRSQRGP